MRCNYRGLSRFIYANVPRVCVERIINANFYEMKHTEKYLQAKWVTENPKGYDERDVERADSYCNAYLDGYNQALRIHDVVGRSEQLLAYTEWLKKQGLLNATVSKLIVKKYIGK